jgi:hypothetical protein
VPRISLREKQDRTLTADVEGVLSCREWIHAKTNRTLDKTRILGVVAAGEGAEHFLPYTIPKIIRQISEMERGADIIIGLNNGYECQTPIHRFTFLPDVQVIHLYTEEKTGSTIPANVFPNRESERTPYHLTNVDLQGSTHRIFIVHQKKGPYSAGKIRVLGDIYGSLLMKSIENGWIPPELLVTFDVESQFLVNQDGGVPDLESPGLVRLVSELQNHPRIDILGAGPKYAVYRKGLVDGAEVLLPDFGEQLPPIPRFLSAVHGRYRGYKWKPGGGTIGRTDLIISLFVVIATRYPGIRIEDVQLTILAEDVQLTILAHHAGFQGNILMDVVFTNRVPRITDMTTDGSTEPAWIQQMYRWIAGAHMLETIYGKHNVRSIVSTGFPWSIFRDLIGFRRRFKGREETTFRTVLKNLKVLLAAFVTFHKIKKKAATSPDILQG